MAMEIRRKSLHGASLALFLLLLSLMLPSVLRAESLSWTTRAPMLTARSRAASAAAGGKVYVIGGQNVDRSQTLATVEAYDPTTSTWLTKAGLPSPRYASAAAAFGDRWVYVTGGYSPYSGGWLASCDAYDSATDVWSSKPSMPTSRMSPASAALDNKIYVLGGTSGGIYLSTVEAFNVTTGLWETLAPMPTARIWLGAAAVNGKLYAIGGRNSSVYLDVVEEYDPATNSWTTKRPMPAPGAARCDVINGKIYVLYNNQDTRTIRIYIYDPVLDIWSSASPPLVERYAGAFNAANNKLYYAGGYDPVTNLALSTNEEGAITVGNTPVGSPVEVNLGSGVKVVFSNVAGSGNTSYVTSSPPYNPPSGFQFGGTAYDISTTASYSSPIVVTLPYDPAAVSGSESGLKLFHWNGAVWENCTVSVDTVGKTITGRVTSLSPFAVGFSATTTAVGYNTFWLAVTTLGLVLAGVWLLRKRSFA